MTIQMLNTKAEQALLHMFDANLERFPGGNFVRDLRRSAIGAFASKGLPSRRLEEWKYTDLKTVFKDAHPLSLLKPSSKNISVGETHFSPPTWLQDLFGDNLIIFLDGLSGLFKGSSSSSYLLASLVTQFDTALSSWIFSQLKDTSISNSSDHLLNSALFTDGALLKIEDGQNIQKPFCIFTSASGQKDNIFCALRNLVRVGKGAKISLVEMDTTGQYLSQQSSHLTQLDVGDGAEVTHIKIVLGCKDSIHLGHCQVNLGASATYKPFHLMLGEGLIRSSLNLNFNGENGLFEYGGVSVAKGSGHVDNTLVIDHKVPRCTSREHLKAVLDGESKAIFQGKVVVRPDAQKTDGKQMAQALMLSPFAEFDSKPELEIYADDVACGHGSTCTEINNDLLFYCMSRGIPQEAARALLIESFIGEVIDKIEDQNLKDLVFQMAQTALTK